jgi:AraC-like DNA-binding protein
MTKPFYANVDSLDLLNCFIKSIDLKINTAQASEFTHPWDLCISDQMACFYVIVNGSCNLRIDGAENTFRLNRGDMAVLLHNREHCLSSMRTNDSTFPPAKSYTGIYHNTGSAQGTLIRGTFNCDANEIVSLLPEVPPVILANGSDDGMAPWIAGTAKMIAEEFALGQPGAQAIINDLVHLIFEQSIHSHMTPVIPEQRRIRGFLHHPQIGLALYQLQARLNEPWTVMSLARACGMSRSAFAYEFKHEVGMSPMAYLLELRLRRACRLLHDRDMRVRDVCAQIGYRSQPSFTHAFVGRTGLTPGAYRKACAGTGSACAV